MQQPSISSPLVENDLRFVPSYFHQRNSKELSPFSAPLRTSLSLSLSTIFPVLSTVFVPSPCTYLRYHLPFLSSSAAITHFSITPLACSLVAWWSLQLLFLISLNRLEIYPFNDGWILPCCLITFAFWSPSPDPYFVLQGFSEKETAVCATSSLLHCTVLIR